MNALVAILAHFGVALAHPAAACAGGLVRAVWEGAVLAAGTALGLRLFPGLTAKARSMMWSAVFGLVVLLFFAAMMQGGGAGAGSMAGGERIAELHLATGWALALAGLWVLCSVVRAVQLGRSAVHLRGILRRAIPLTTVRMDATDLTERITVRGRTLQQADQGRSVQICASKEVHVPCVAGFGRARILLPADLLASASLPDLEQVVLHEMEHLRRNDHWINLLQKVGLVLFPLNPVLLWVEARVCVERELACDDGVVRATSARKAYATCLANLAEHSLMRRGLSLALGAWERQTELARRVQRILSRPAKELDRVQAGAVVGLLLAGVVGGGWALMRSPELVSFASNSAASPTTSTRTRSTAASLVSNMSARTAASLPAPEASSMLARVNETQSYATSAHPTRVRATLAKSSPLARGFAVQNLVAKNVAPVRNVAPLENAPAREIMAQDVTARSAKEHTLGDPPVTATMVVARHSSQGRVLLNAPVRRNIGSKPAGSTPWIVLTRWQGTVVPVAPGSVAFAVSEDSHFAYAAVPTPDGWLIVQL